MSAALKSLSSYNNTSTDFISELGHRITAVTSEWREPSYLCLIYLTISYQHDNVIDIVSSKKL